MGTHFLVFTTQLWGSGWRCSVRFFSTFFIISHKSRLEKGNISKLRWFFSLNPRKWAPKLAKKWFQLCSTKLLKQLPNQNFIVIKAQKNKILSIKFFSRTTPSGTLYSKQSWKMAKNWSKLVVNELTWKFYYNYCLWFTFLLFSDVMKTTRGWTYSYQCY